MHGLAELMAVDVPNLGCVEWLPSRGPGAPPRSRPRPQPDWNQSAVTPDDTTARDAGAALSGSNPLLRARAPSLNPRYTHLSGLLSSDDSFIPPPPHSPLHHVFPLRGAPADLSDAPPPPPRT